MKRISIALAFSLAASSVSAEMTVRQYLADRDAASKAAFDRLVKPYLTGVGEGLMWANAQLKAQKSAPFFCDPDEVTLTTDEYLSVVDGETKQPYVEPDYPIELLLLKGLQRKYPCK
jgi:hypothetical protein